MAVLHDRNGQPVATITDEQLRRIENGEEAHIEGYEHSDGIAVRKVEEGFAVRVHNEKPHIFSRLDRFIH